MRVNPVFVPLLFVFVLLGTVFGSQLLGLWSVTGRSAVNTANMTAADLKGWMTLTDVMTGIKISKPELYDLMKIPADVPETAALKDLEKIVPGFETSTLRDALTARGAVAPAPVQAAPTAVAPTPVAPAPVAPAPVAPAPVAPAIQPTVRITGTGALSATHASDDGLRPTPTALPPGVTLTVDQIKGSMTLRQVSEQTGVPLGAILEALGLPADVGVDTVLKDLISAGKLTEVTQVRDAVTRLQGK
ncbi:MAG TPA: hypothetical protein PLQ83_04615 [Thermoflexales bacterium]|nr:hypothetical protein [Thermoflexales bacterium]